MMTEDRRHSERFFTDARDFWWNGDFLRLMALRWELAKVRSVLDVGCGRGHWTAALLRVLPGECSVTGVDREPDWVRESAERFAPLGARASFAQGSAERLPFPDASFDMVTCQTVLIHVAQPEAALREMLRVLKPGGLLASAEPCNLAQTRSSLEGPVEEELALRRLELLCERGKRALGEGDNSLGDLLPGLFSGLGLRDIEVYLSDKATAIFPPYSGPGQQETLADELRAARTGDAMYGRETTQRYFLAGGGTPQEFERLWSLTLERLRRQEVAVAAKSYHRGGGSIMYLVSGRKPVV